MNANARTRRFAWLEWALLVVGIACLGYYGYKSAEARQLQRDQSAALEQQLAARDTALPSPEAVESPTERRAPGASDAPSASEATVAPSESEAAAAPSESDAPGAPSSRDTLSAAGSRAPLALLDIPRLRVSAPVLSGDDAATLDVAIGHLPDTPKPWEAGNSALAAHRDGLFRPLRNIKVGDELHVRTMHGDFTYEVRETKIVMPDDLSVLAPTDEHTLTLITCYPFNFIGSAPKRFVVHAERVDTGTR